MIIFFTGNSFKIITNLLQNFYLLAVQYFFPSLDVSLAIKKEISQNSPARWNQLSVILFLF